MCILRTNMKTSVHEGVPIANNSKAIEQCIHCVSMHFVQFRILFLLLLLRHTPIKFVLKLLYRPWLSSDKYSNVRISCIIAKKYRNHPFIVCRLKIIYLKFYQNIRHCHDVYQLVFCIGKVRRIISKEFIQIIISVTTLLIILYAFYYVTLKWS